MSVPLLYVGTVCDDYWDQDDALVVCTQLGFVVGATAVQGGRFGQGSFWQQIWLDNVQCTGSEMYLSDCDSQGFGIHNCAHYEDAGVVCEGLSKLQLYFSMPARVTSLSVCRSVVQHFTFQIINQAIS